MHSAADTAEKRLALAVLASIVVHSAILASFAGGRSVSHSVMHAPKPPMTIRFAELEQPTEPLVEPPPMPETPTAFSPREAKPETAPQPAAPQVGLTPLLEHYYRGVEVDVRAEEVNIPDIQYPEEALARRLEGRVVMRLLIDRFGRLREATVVESDPPGLFNDAASQAVRTLTFKPARLNGHDVNSIKVIEIPFHPDCRRTGSCIQAGTQNASIATESR